jgi:hypothetical protein
MWLLSEPEVFGRSCWGESTYDGGTIQLPIFAGSFRHIVKGLGKGAAEGGSRNAWWLASPCSSNTTYICTVGGTGNASYASASNSNGVAPGFNIY